MRIPVGEFGFRVPDRAPAPSVGPEAFVMRGVSDLAEGGLRIGEAGANIGIANQREDALVADEHRREAKALAREQEMEAKQLAREAKRAEAMTIHARTQNDLATESDRIRIGIGDGSIHKDTAGELWREASTKIVEGRLKEVDKANVELVRASIENDLGNHGRQISHAVVQRNRQDIGAGLQGYLEQQERFATTDLPTAIKQAHMAIDSLGPQAGLNPEQIGKAKQAFTENATFNVAASFVSRNRDNGAALQKFLDSLPANKNLDPQKARILEGQALGYITRLENKAIAAENRRLALLDRTWNSISARIDNGLTVPPEEMAAAVKASKGTPLEDYAKSVVDSERLVADLLKLPPAKQVEFVTDTRALYMKEGASKEDWQSLGRMDRTVRNTVKQITEQPLAYAAIRTGAEVEGLDLTKPESWQSNLSNRATVLLAQRKQLGGQSGLQALYPNEVAALRNTLKGAPPSAQRDMLAKLRQGLGDDTVFKATMAQIAPDDPVTAMAGIYAARGLESSKDRSIAEYMLRGQMALRPDTKEDGKPGKGGLLPMPPDQDMQRAFANYSGNAFAGREQTNSAFYQAARAIYAAKAVDEGDYSGNLNPKRWSESMGLATGGVTTHNGRSIVLPYGMKYGEFKDGLKSRTAALEARLDPEQKIGSLRALPLENIGDGQYVFRAGDSFIVGKDGKPLVVDFTR